MNATILYPDFAKRRPRAIPSADAQRIKYQRRLAELEEQREAIRERLPHVVDGSELRTHLLIDLACIQGDLELLEELIGAGNVVSLEARR